MSVPNTLPDSAVSIEITPPTEQPKLSGAGLRAGRWLSALLGLALSGVFLYLALHKVDIGAVRSAFANASLIWVMPMIAITLSSFWLRSIRWLAMFPRVGRPKAGQCFNVLMIGGLANNVVAGRVGDVARAGLIAQFVPNLGTGGAFATIVLERVMDGLAIFALLGIAFLAAPLPPWVVRVESLGAVVFLSLLVFLFVVSVRTNRGLTRMKPPSGHRLAKAHALFVYLLNRFAAGLTPLKNVRQVLGLFVLTLVIWLLDMSVMFVGFRAFGLVLPFFAAIVGVVFLAVGMMMPGAPGFVGTYQFFVVTALGLYRVPESQALAVALFLNFFTFSLNTLVGLLALSISGLNWSSWIRFRS